MTTCGLSIQVASLLGLTLLFETDEILMPKAHNQQEGDSRCELCGRQKSLTKHHLIPRGVHRKKRFLDRFGKKEMHRRILMICKDCHAGIHDLIPEEKVLAEEYNTKALLLAHEGIRRHVA
jgi:hypothetical protein